jgi:hypothetical protein
VAFGGLSPFGKEDTNTELAKLKRGGSIAVMPPLDTMVATRYLHRIVDLLENGDQGEFPCLSSFSCMLGAFEIQVAHLHLMTWLLWILDLEIATEFTFVC